MLKKVICIVVLLALLVCVMMVVYISYNFATQIAKPSVSSLEEEIQWEKDNNLWGNFDAYETNTYEVLGLDDYVLHAMLVKNPNPSDTYVILSHGIRSNRYGSVKYVDAYMQLGFNCIIYDVRDHGENEETPISLGQFESIDLLKLIEDTYTRYEVAQLGLHGESMGSAISLSVLQYKPDVDFVVADCGFDNLYELIDEVYRSQHFGILMPFINTAVKVLYKYDMKKTSPKDALIGNTIPICFIHGDADDYISPENSIENQKATAGYSEMHLIAGAAHAKAMSVLGSDAYAKIISDFLANMW